MKNISAYSLLLLLFSIHLSRADDKVSAFEKTMKDSVLHYRSGKVTEALEILQKAKGILETEQTKQVGNVLPDAPATWKAEDLTTEDVPSYLGGGKVVKKQYRATKSQEEILVEIYFGSSMIKLLRDIDRRSLITLVK